ncbi:Katanin p80 WD40 repeat-containing subunit B1-like [Quillaja saponaria]|uniref:Katanin p80 WD40 repeat-containing subunit B1 homolog n=1 Tax=Quillaja saponaria TaxID=32244 RepID=A0AAD7PVM8_QUISA|nr:Katanin p80 WD40 repeat-containing subunit B1-like [Quillaja saponaria]
MAKRGYKLQEFVAHSSSVNCLKIGKKACRLFITGGDDHNVNLWTIGKPTSVMSLCGHTSPVECVAFDSAEVLVLAGASTGMIKLWDLEEAKIVRTLTGHRSNCTSVEFHPFGEFFASGSTDTYLKVWDIRKKGCIHTYKGHSQGVSSIKFTPDGRWVVSGGFDNVVKVWDLTAGKLLHDFKFHEGHIRSLDFHPLEFLLATGSADGTVKFWDLETFELIGSARREAAGVRSIAFHPDGGALFAGLDDSLKVFSWEPVICHDAVDMGWTTLGDLCIHEGKLLGCSYYQNSVGVWAADISLIEPYGAGLELKKDEGTEQNFDLQGSQQEKAEIGVRSAFGSRCRPPDDDAKEIKTIYVDSSGGKPVASKRSESLLNSPKTEHPVPSKEFFDLHTQKKNPAIGVDANSNQLALRKSFAVASVVPLDVSDGKDSAKTGNETITFSRTKPGMLLRPSHTRRPSSGKYDLEKSSVDGKTGSFGNIAGNLDGEVDVDIQIRPRSEDGAKKSCEDKHTIMKSVTNKLEKSLSPQTHSNQEKCDKPPPRIERIGSVKYVNGVAVVRGRTRSLVERFERRETIETDEDQSSMITPTMIPETNDSPISLKSKPQTSGRHSNCGKEPPILGSVSNSAKEPQMSERDSNSAKEPQISVIDSYSAKEPRISGRDSNSAKEPQVSGRDSYTAKEPRISGRDSNSAKEPQISGRDSYSAKEPQISGRDSNSAKGPQISVRVSNSAKVAQTSRRDSNYAKEPHISVRVSNSAKVPQISGRDSNSAKEPQISVRISNSPKEPQISGRDLNSAKEPQISGRDSNSAKEPQISVRVSNSAKVPQIFGRDSNSAREPQFSGSTLRSRLTKLQVVRHFWYRNDIKGAISALRKLPDHSVQADVISVLVEKMQILSLDLFSCLLPVLTGLLDSKIERHINVSLEMLLKLIAVFGPVINSTISAPPAVGVDLHAEKRLECCNLCFIQMQKIQKILPLLIRRGGLLAKCAQELNLVLQGS